MKVEDIHRLIIELPTANCGTAEELREYFSGSADDKMRIDRNVLTRVLREMNEYERTYGRGELTIKDIQQSFDLDYLRTIEDIEPRHTPGETS